MDIVTELGSMAFASRLKRLSDRLKSGVTTLYHHHGVDFNDNWFLVGYMLSKHGSMTITELAKKLGISSSTVSKIAVEMVGRNLVTIQTDYSDRRRRLLSLTDKGEDAVHTLEPVWKAVADCTAELIASSGYDILKMISVIEEELGKRSMFLRVVERLSETQQQIS